MSVKLYNKYLVSWTHQDVTQMQQELAGLLQKYKRKIKKLSALKNPNKEFIEHYQHRAKLCNNLHNAITWWMTQYDWEKFIKYEKIQPFLDEELKLWERIETEELTPDEAIQIQRDKAAEVKYIIQLLIKKHSPRLWEGSVKWNETTPSVIWIKNFPYTIPADHDLENEQRDQFYISSVDKAFHRIHLILTKIERDAELI